MLKSSLRDYSDAYIHVKGKIKITGAGDDATARQADKRDKGVAVGAYRVFWRETGSGFSKFSTT